MAERLPNPPGDFVAVDAGKAKVDQRYVGLLFDGELNRAQTFSGFEHRMPKADCQQHPQCRSSIAGVFDNQDFERPLRLTEGGHLKSIPAKDRLMATQPRHSSCLDAHMEPIAINALAVMWEFRCHGSQVPALSWSWRCRSPDGEIVAASQVFFRSLHEAVADAMKHGFHYRLHADER